MVNQQNKQIELFIERDSNLLRGFAAAAPAPVPTDIMSFAFKWQTKIKNVTFTICISKYLKKNGELCYLVLSV